MRLRISEVGVWERGRREIGLDVVQTGLAFGTGVVVPLRRGGVVAGVCWVGLRGWGGDVDLVHRCIGWHRASIGGRRDVVRGVIVAVFGEEGNA
jgi:hypothetical protein